MAIFAKGSCAGFLWTLSVLSLQNVLASPGFGYTLTMPLNSVQMYDDRAKRSLATICVEIKPNGPLEEPYYMCKGADFPQFPKLSGVSNTATTNYGSATGTGDISVQQSATNFAQSNYNGAASNNGVGNTGQTGHSQLESQASLHQKTKQTSTIDAANSHLQSQFNTAGIPRKFLEQAPAKSLFHNPAEQHQQHFAAEYQQQFQPTIHQQQQHHYQQQAQQKQFHQNQQEHSTVTQPGTNFKSFFHKTDQFFRPVAKSESNASNGKLYGYESIYSDGSSGAVSQQNGDFIPSTPHSTQPTASFGTQAAAPNYQSTSAATATGSGGSSLAADTNQRFESSQYTLHAAADCGEDCGKPVPQTASSSGAAQNGAAQYAAKSTSYDTQHSKFLVAGGVSSQHANAHTSTSASISNRDEQNSSPVPSTSFPPAAIARTSDASSFRYGGNGAAAFTAPDGSPVPNMGPNDTPSFGSAFLRPTSNAAYYSSEASSSDTLLGISRTQAAHRQHIEAQKKYKHSYPIRHQGQFIPTQSVPSANRYRSTIGDEVLQMPNWGFSTDELDLYRSTSGENEDTKFELTSMPLPTPAPARLIPLEYLEDPVMRAFYSSLDDVGPLPAISPAYPVHRPAGYAQPPPRRMTYQPPLQSCSYPPAPLYYNYNPCPPQREYSFQPVFIALPCYGQSMYQALGSPAPAEVTGNPTTHSLISTQTQTAVQTPQVLPQREVYMNGKNFAASQSESAAIIGSTQNIQQNVSPKVVPSTTVASTTKEDSNESSESLEDSTPTVTKASQPKIKNDSSGSAETKLASSEKPSMVKFATNLQDLTKSTTVTPSPSAEKIGASISASTPPSADSVGGQMVSEMSTTFKSLILTARKLAQMVTTSQEEEDMMYKDDIPTPRPAPKKVRHASRSSSNGGGGNKRRYIQQ